MKTLADIFRKPNPPTVPPRVPVRGECQEKIQQVNQERTQMKNASQSNPFTNAEPLRMPIVDTYPEELQPVHPEKNDFFPTKKKFSSYTKNRKCSKNENLGK